MSKQITIPSDNGTPVVVVLNGVKYSFAAGDTVTVPDEVAALFESNEANGVTYGRRAVAPLEAPKRKASKPGVPVLTDDEGNLYADAEGVASAALGEIYVEGHKVIIPSEE